MSRQTGPTFPNSPTLRTPVPYFHQLAPGFLAGIAQVMKDGAKARGIPAGDVSWQGRYPQRVEELLDHTFHHLTEALAIWQQKTFLNGEFRRHILHAACNLMMAWWVAGGRLESSPTPREAEYGWD